MKTNILILALIGLSASVIVGCGSIHKIAKNNQRIIDTSGLKTPVAKNFALDLQDDGLKEIKPPSEKLPPVKFANPYRTSSRSTIAICGDSSQLAKKLKDIAALELFLRGELDINTPSEKKCGRVTVSEIAFTPLEESLINKIADSYKFDELRTNPNKTHGVYLILPENNGLYFISTENIATLAVTLDLSLKGPGGNYYAKIMFTVNVNSPKIRLNYLTEGIFLPPFETLNYDAMEQMLFHVINDLRKKAFNLSTEDGLKQL